MFVVVFNFHFYALNSSSVTLGQFQLVVTSLNEYFQYIFGIINQKKSAKEFLFLTFFLFGIFLSTEYNRFRGELDVTAHRRRRSGETRIIAMFPRSNQGISCPVVAASC